MSAGSSSGGSAGRVRIPGSSSGVQLMLLPHRDTFRDFAASSAPSPPAPAASLSFFSFIQAGLLSTPRALSPPSPSPPSLAPPSLACL